MKTFVLKRSKAQKKPGLDDALKQALNPQQWAAATHGKGPALIIAGAGTGKTRVLTYRVAHLINQGASPQGILLLTFTRRAAAQMLTRAAQLVGPSSQGIEGGTFHAFANRILRRHASLIGFDPTFTVLDDSDGADTLDLIRSRHVTKGRRFPRKRTIRSLFSQMNNNNQPLGQALQQRFPQFLEHEKALTALHIEWVAYKKSHNLMDFDDLLLYLHALLSNNSDICLELRRLYPHILVDEYQDTNQVQGALVELIAGKNGNLVVVGDEAQSIYGFRGADVRNILDFPNRFPETVIYRLEQNYRSTAGILTVANTVISGAKEGFGKALFTERTDGELPLLVTCPDASAQAEFVADQILTLREQGIGLGEQAVLFRNARLGADLELALARKGIPFQKFGGLRFFDSAHVKDVIAHLRVHQNPRDIVAWHRLLKLVPGIGSRSAETLCDGILKGEEPADLGQNAPSGRSKKGLLNLADLFKTLGDPHLEVGDKLQHTLTYYQPYLEARYDDHPRRLKDLQQLFQLSVSYTSLDAFLTDLVLDPPNSGFQEAERPDSEDEILTLSTIHSAKGLEWDALFVLWAADGFFPSGYAFEDPDALEEERRLMYVAITRAKTQLMLTYPMLAQDRRSGQYLTTPSRFLQELGEDILEPARLIQE